MVNRSVLVFYRGELIYKSIIHVTLRFPCKTTDKTDFERRSTTPKNWKRLAKDKNAIKMLSEIVGIGAEGIIYITIFLQCVRNKTERFE